MSTRRIPMKASLVFFSVTLLLTAVLVALPSAVSAQPVSEKNYEYKTYTVKKGDTLWEIAARKLNNPLQWALLWRANPELRDPDWLIPGRELKIPVGYMLPGTRSPLSVYNPEEMEAAKKEMGLKEKSKEPAKPVEPMPVEVKEITPIVDRQTILASGYIAGTAPDDGTIVGSPSQRSFFGNNDRVYIKPAAMKEMPEIGDRFYVLNKVKEVVHPVNRTVLGKLVRYKGILEVKEITEDGIVAEVLEAYEGVFLGDKIEEFYMVELPFMTNGPRKPAVDGVVIRYGEEKKIGGHFETLHIDRGQSSGLKATDIIMTVMPGSKQGRNGVLQIIDVKENTATAIILSSELDISPGDSLMGYR